MPSARQTTASAVKPGREISMRSGESQVANEGFHGQPTSKPDSRSCSFIARGLLLIEILDDQAVEQMDRAVRMARVARIVRDHDDRRALAVQIAQQLHHRLAVRRIEVSRGLVSEENERLARDGARDGDTLLLTARELRRIVLHAMRHPDLLERIVHALLALAPFHARDT